MADGQFTTVLDFALTGEKEILSFGLDNGCVLRCSPEHRLFLASGEEIRAKDVKVGQRLKSPSTPFPTRTQLTNSVGVRSITHEDPEMCCDISTESKSFYLPESDTVVHNCEDLACWRAAELRVRYGIAAEPTFIWKVRPGGGYLYHIQVLYPDGRIEDPSRRLGMR